MGKLRFRLWVDIAHMQGPEPVWHWYAPRKEWRCDILRYVENMDENYVLFENPDPSLKWLEELDKWWYDATVKHKHKVHPDIDVWPLLGLPWIGVTDKRFASNWEADSQMLTNSGLMPPDIASLYRVGRWSVINSADGIRIATNHAKGVIRFANMNDPYRYTHEKRFLEPIPTYEQVLKMTEKNS